MDPNELSEFRAAGHRLVDLLADTLESVEGGALFPDVTPGEVERLFDEPLPREGRPMDQVLADLEHKLLPYCVHVNHPGYFGLITPTPTPPACWATSQLRRSTRTSGPGRSARPRRRWSDAACAG